MTDYAEIIERLEKAVGPDRAIDRDICRAQPKLKPFGFDKLQDWPRYTASIDAALTLVPFSDTGANCWGIESDRSSFAAHVSRNNVRSGHWLLEGFGKSAAIALCIAALKAREALARNEERKP